MRATTCACWLSTGTLPREYMFTLAMFMVLKSLIAKQDPPHIESQRRWKLCGPKEADLPHLSEDGVHHRDGHEDETLERDRHRNSRPAIQLSKCFQVAVSCVAAGAARVAHSLMRRTPSALGVPYNPAGSQAERADPKTRKPATSIRAAKAALKLSCSSTRANCASANYGRFLFRSKTPKLRFEPVLVWPSLHSPELDGPSHVRITSLADSDDISAVGACRNNVLLTQPTALRLQAPWEPVQE
ncbi:hypothetical protein BDK51DRAFT_37647 [Blyttiomyces helicus]|uniref:Uncharacterized protein n=1 Tax=Blyttiomyces helicus TaxID=388810 RepID=A0A4P9WKU5_9FUNG|nr:hypothetical protein BDK51DRAFT_37647 [Blyttiomyces helicus]|eukprot:RKO91236.1 hypothetical protein BDK51DRAFT_37647 [Blyttiomyces helicus]